MCQKETLCLLAAIICKQHCLFWISHKDVILQNVTFYMSLSLIGGFKVNPCYDTHENPTPVSAKAAVVWLVPGLFSCIRNKQFFLVSLNISHVFLNTGYLR